ncbi:MAG: rhodanese-like domain-containing protein [Hydrogenovibrio sp.]|nr:rhodanese-like domain-containing protein [Hydrogenovibrio sp.]
MADSLKSLVSEAKSHIKEVDCEQAKDLIAQGYKILDVREPAEFLDGTLPMALHIPRGMLEPMCDKDFAGHNPELSDLNQPWLIFCQSGGRGALAADTMQKMGYTQVVNLLGGYSAWKASGGETYCPPIENGLIRCDHPWNPGYQNS